jgi:coenzyme F420-reducing hydrogenase beta subunit
MINQVIENDCCIGCGVCVAIAPKHFKIEMDDRGLLQAQRRGMVNDLVDAEASKVCPFADTSLNEDDLAQKFLTKTRYSHPRIGNYIKCYVGQTSEQDMFLKSSSGGVGRWFLRELLRQNKVDQVVHVVSEDVVEGETNLLYRYDVSKTEEEVVNTAKSAYYPVEMSKVIKYIRENDGRYAITGVPCFIKAIRNLCLRDELFAARIRFTVGIVCGHLKSKFYAEMIGWQLGVEPQKLKSLDFRVKIPGKKANEKGVAAKSIDGTAEVSPPKTVQEIFGTNYGHGYFKYPACDFCDDVLAETADLSIGDAWLPQFLEQGTTIIVSRSEEVTQMLDNAMLTSELNLVEISADEVAKSQDAGLRHRREGLAYRLYLNDKQNRWKPTKRVRSTKEHLSWRERKIHRLRMVLRSASFEYFKTAKSDKNFEYFVEHMSRINRKYAKAYTGVFKSNIIYKAAKRITRLLIVRKL